MTHLPSLVALSALALGWPAAPAQESAPKAAERQDPGPPLPGKSEADAALERAFAEAGVRIDRTAGAIAFPVAIEVRNDPLEYLLVSPHGAIHEALFVTEVAAEVLNAAFLALGLERGENVEYRKKDPQPSEEELRAGARAFDVVPPKGDAVELYAAWREGDDTFFYRVEDLVRDLARSRTMRRHAWVYLGSRMIETRRQEGSVFAAAAEGNLACISFFTPGNTLLTAALPECTSQSTWLPNAWLLPRAGSPVMLIASRGPLTAPPPAWKDALPTVAPESDESSEDD